MIDEERINWIRADCAKVWKGYSWVTHVEFLLGVIDALRAENEELRSRLVAERGYV